MLILRAGILLGVFTIGLSAGAAEPTPSTAEVLQGASATRNTEIREIRAAHPRPEEQIAYVAAWIAAHPQDDTRKERSPADSPVPSGEISDPIARGIGELRKTTPDPEDQVRKVAEFLQSHRSEMEQQRAARAEALAAVKAARQSDQAARPEAPADDVKAQMTDAVRDIRVHSSDAQEQIRLIAELLQLNQELLKRTLNESPR
jgi:hypothetical protein